jgi:amidohydrolase
LRADIDALPVQEETELPFSSRVEGCMHACGHDVHTAGLLGVAASLVPTAESLPGRYVFVFQPAEEQVSGAQAMVDGGLLEQFAPSVTIGCHVASTLPLGLVATRPGLVMAAVRSLRVSITGGGGHGALQPRQGNVVLAVATFANRLEAIVADLETDGTACVCSPGLIAAGTAPNVVPTTAMLYGTLRFFESEQLAVAERRLEQLAGEVASEFDVRVNVEQTFRTGPVRNDASVTARVLDIAGNILGRERVVNLPRPVTASDDVSVFLERVPGCYVFVGGAMADGSSGNHHSPTFNVDEETLRTAATVLGAAAVELAGAREPGPR